MGIVLLDQARALAGALALGMAVGLVYDLIRIPRARIPLLGGVLDFLFWVAATAALFFCLWPLPSFPAPRSIFCC